MYFLIAPPMPAHVECYYKYCEELFYELEAQEAVQDPQERKRYHSPEKPLGDQERSKRMRSEESVSSSSIVTSLPGLEEEWGEVGVTGVTGVVERYLSDNTGEIMVRVKRPVKVLFHANQVWCGGDSGDFVTFTFLILFCLKTNLQVKCTLPSWRPIPPQSSLLLRLLARKLGSMPGWSKVQNMTSRFYSLST